MVYFFFLAIFVASQFTMADLYAAHEGSLPCPITEDCSPTPLEKAPRAEATSFAGDKRLPAFGYTIETVNMLLLPMVTTE